MGKNKEVVKLLCKLNLVFQEFDLNNSVIPIYLDALDGLNVDDFKT